MSRVKWDKMGHPLFSRNLGKVLAISMVKVGLVCVDENRNYAEPNIRTEWHKVDDPFYPTSAFSGLGIITRCLEK